MFHTVQYLSHFNYTVILIIIIIRLIYFVVSDICALYILTHCEYKICMSFLSRKYMTYKLALYTYVCITELKLLTLKACDVSYKKLIQIYQ